MALVSQMSLVSQIRLFYICLHCRAAETSQDVESLRPPRFIHEDGVIRPYKEREGLGSQMLQVRKQGTDLAL